MPYDTLQITSVHTHARTLARTTIYGLMFMLQEVARVTETITSISIQIACGTRLYLYLSHYSTIFMPFKQGTISKRKVSRQPISLNVCSQPHSEQLK